MIRTTTWIPMLQNVAANRRMSSIADRTTRTRRPRLPVPNLRQTLDKYLLSVTPLLQEDARKGGEPFSEAYSRRKVWADEFEVGIGKEVQERLIALDQVSPNNWLEDNFWLRKAYLESRSPLLINSNWWLAFQDNDNESRPPSTPKSRVNAWQIKRAVSLLHGCLDFRAKMESQELHPGHTSTAMWIRECTSRIWNRCRRPERLADELSIPLSSHPSYGTVLVMIHNWCYSVTVHDSATGHLISAGDMESRLVAVANDAQARLDAGQKAPIIGVLSADDRHGWSENLTYLEGLSPRNREVYAAISNSIMGLSLESGVYTLSSSYSTAAQRDRDERLHTMRGTVDNISNRLLDKSFTLIVDPHGRAGAMGEHSPTDALVPSMIAEYAIVHSVGKTSDEPCRPSQSGWERLDWVVDDLVHSRCQLAHSRAAKIIETSDNRVFWFSGFGSDWITGHTPLKPDAYVQMAMQLAWYRTRGSMTATYETALTRMFHHGRTETIRTLTEAMRAFLLCMSDSSTTAATRVDLVLEAAQNHSRLTREAATGRGIDRHLLALRDLLQPNENVKLFDDALFSRSSEWKLSTSGLSAGLLFTGTGFGAAYSDGYGINYLIAPSMIKFGIESKIFDQTTSTVGFMQAIELALHDMKNVLIADYSSPPTSRL